jgi:hypothetical protein
MSMRLPASPCLNCGKRSDAVTGVDTTDRPSSGDIAICFYCGHIMAYAADLSLRALTGAEMHQVAGNKRILAIQRARQKVKPP